MASATMEQAEPLKGWKPRALARAIKVAPQTIYNAINTGEISPVWRFGKSIVIPQSSVDRWLDSKSSQHLDD